MSFFTAIVEDFALVEKLKLSLGGMTLDFRIECDFEIDAKMSVIHITNIWLQSLNDSSFVDPDEFLYSRIKLLIRDKIINDPKYTEECGKAIVSTIKINESSKKDQQ
jgi:hypothetical protein